jgi:hypothetical protein
MNTAQLAEQPKINQPILLELLENHERLISRLDDVTQRIIIYAENLNGSFPHGDDPKPPIKYSRALGRIEELSTALKAKIEQLEYAAELLSNSVGS